MAEEVLCFGVIMSAYLSPLSSPPPEKPTCVLCPNNVAVSTGPLPHLFAMWFVHVWVSSYVTLRWVSLEPNGAQLIEKSNAGMNVRRYPALKEQEEGIVVALCVIQNNWS